MDKNNHFPQVFQTPGPGQSRVMYCGDTLRLTLDLSLPARGRAWVRTNLGSARKARQEIIDRVEKNEIKLDGGWQDIEMVPQGENRFSLVLPLCQTGAYEAKCFFIPQGSSVPVWPKGDNARISVEPAGTCCANIIYNAFVRQFGPSRTRTTRYGDDDDLIRELDGKGYTVIPESGKFRDLVKEVKFIFSDLGCRALLLLPIHPTPTTYARMGRFGSPYAALNFTDVDPALAQFDPSATPLEQFMELVDAVHFHGGYLFMDIAVNHTGWAAAIHETHPQWLVRDDQGKIEAPGAWGVVWEDLTRLDWTRIDLWEYMAGIFLLWCRRGVDGFRCDAGYMIPVEAWEYMVAKVRQAFPDVLFFLEGLGGPMETTCQILTRAGFNWAYSELFQNFTKQELEAYLPVAWEISETCGHLIHFAETHDNNRLASVSKTHARMRTALCALFSHCGGFGFANGVEWFADQKINVHESLGLNWGSPKNQVKRIGRLTRILKTHPCFFARTRLTLASQDNPCCLVLWRRNRAENRTKDLFILANLDCDTAQKVSWRHDAVQVLQWHDLVSGSQVHAIVQGPNSTVVLEPGSILAISPDIQDLALADPEHPDQDRPRAPDRVIRQKYQALLLSTLTAVRGMGNIAALDLGREALAFARDPIEHIRAMNPDTREARVILFDIPADLRRQVMVPPGFFLLVRCAKGFRAQILKPADPNRLPQKESPIRYAEGLPCPDKKGYFTLIRLPKAEKRHLDLILELRILDPAPPGLGATDATTPAHGKSRVETTRLLVLAPMDRLVFRPAFTRQEIWKTPHLKLLATTRTGGMMRAAADFGRLESRYDGLLGANLDPLLPENRWMAWARCRIWAVFQGYSRALALDCLKTFWFSYDGGGQWQFQVPTSEGKSYILDLDLSLDRNANRVCLRVHRKASDPENSGLLEDRLPVTLIFRPDIEDRDFHGTVKAFQGPEISWPKAITRAENGFSFALSRKSRLDLSLAGGCFTPEPEWQYMVFRPKEATRGLDPESDLFSPGYFTISCLGSETACLTGAVVPDTAPCFSATAEPPPANHRIRRPTDLASALGKSLDAFLVDRGNNKSVIAGFPWFLDWGRDSLIFCRSLIELKQLKEAKAVLGTFGRFEENGTLPNMICGRDAGNRETSDAPLWFFACCRDLWEQTRDLPEPGKQPAADANARQDRGRNFFDQEMGGRPLREILVSMGRSMARGTPTGVKMDPATSLLYSPAHFTWMDTNFPAGTPRQGYPVEIQALWYNALTLLAELDKDGPWQARAARVKEAVIRLYWQADGRYFSDCRHSDGPVGAEKAEPDDCLRPNQLFLITLGMLRARHRPDPAPAAAAQATGSAGADQATGSAGADQDTESAMARQAVETSLALLVPGGIRSLADRGVARPLMIKHQGRLLCDPHAPYAGTYQGDEDFQRKPAYHNGTAWTWQFPVFCEAWAEVFGKQSHPTCLAWLGSLIRLMRSGAAGFIPEILDGDFPHTPRGCDAQAWASSEAARVIHKLSGNL